MNKEIIDITILEQNPRINNMMKRVIYVLPFFILYACGGVDSIEEQVTEADTVYTADHEWISSAEKLKEKLGHFQAKFLEEIGNKEVEETICGESSKVPYRGNQSEMNVWLMTTYMIDNFTVDDFAKSNFNMPEALIRGETPLSELNWMNMNSHDDLLFEIYRQYPDLGAIPKMAEDGSSNEMMVSSPHMMLKAIEDGLFGLIAITDYLPPVVENESTYETGYVMGYIMFAEWESGALSCISPFHALNDESKDFSGVSQGEMKDDLQLQTFSVIDSIARLRTGFTGEVYVNASGNLETYRP